MNTYREKWKESSLKEKIEIIGIVFGLILTFCGAVIGALALREYETTNELTLAGQMQTVDRELTMITFAHPYLNSIWAYIPENLHGKARADALLKAFLINKKDNVKVTGDTWKTIQDFEKILWSQENLHDKEMQKLVQGYIYVESILYLVCSVIDSEIRGKVLPRDTKTYIAYLYDLGTHPLFLNALWFGHKGGYFSPEVATRLQEELLKDNETKIMAESIYKELLDKNWPQKTGKSN